MVLAKILEPIESQLKSTDQLMAAALNHDVTILNKIQNSTPLVSGKKIRSALLFLLAGLNGTPDDNELTKIAAAVELFHCSSLIHDDIIDNSEFRRGKKTINKYFGNSLSVLWGDFLFIKSLDLLVPLKKRFVLEIFLKTASLMVEGQILEIDNCSNFSMPVKTYFSIIKKKTASLFAAIADIICHLHDHSSRTSSDYRQFGQNFGLIFQMSDDLLDIFSQDSGKDRFRDLHEGKMTYPLILLSKKYQPSMFHQLINADEEEIFKIIQNLPIKDKVMEKISDFSHSCYEFLGRFKDSDYKMSLLNLLDFMQNRVY